MDVVELTRELVSRRSDNSEEAVAHFIAAYLNRLGYLRIEHQAVEENRANIIAHDGEPPRLMFCCHMDTVPASPGWAHKPFAGEIEGDHLYGLGAADMKGGLACVLAALAAFSRTRGLYLLFDVDEERKFKGMEAFLEGYGDHPHPELVVLPEPGEQIQNGHRGVIEIGFRVRGETGHASRPESGRNAILGAMRAVTALTERLKEPEFTHPDIGKTSCNLAYLRGGSFGGTDESGQLLIQEVPNKIPDIAEVVLDIRPATADLRAPIVVDMLDGLLQAEGFKLEQSQLRLDYGSLYIPRERLASFEAVAREALGEVEYADLTTFGYGEGQMLHERWGVDCVYLGPEPRDMAHKVDEYVSIESLQRVQTVYEKLIAHYCASE